MYKKKLVFSIFCASLLFQTIPAYAADAPGIVLQEEEKTGVKKQEKWEDKLNQETAPYFSDEEFASFCTPLKEQIRAGSTEAALKLYVFFASNGATAEQVKQVLEEGYLTDCIEDLKQAGVLPEEYVIPENIQAIGPAIPREGIPAASPDNHDFDGISKEAEEALVIWSGDEEEKNAYLNIPQDTEESKLSGKTLSMTYLNKEPFDINFMSGTGYADVSWHFQNELTKETDLFDLQVEHDEEHIRFQLGSSLPYEAEVIVQMQEPNTAYNAYHLDGSFRETFQTDANGYLTLYAKNDSDSVRLAKAVLAEGGMAAGDGGLRDLKPGVGSEPDNKILTLCIAILGGIAIMAFGVMMASNRSKKR